MTWELLRAAGLCLLFTIIPPPPASAQGEIVEYYGVDAIGSIRVVFDGSGALTSRRDYAPFGEELTSINADPKMFARLFRDSESDSDYAEARTDQSRTGRFNAVDPVYAGLFEPQKWNRYSYGANRPLSYVDPRGTGGVCATTFCEEVIAAMPPPRYAEGWWTKFLGEGLTRAGSSRARRRDV